MNAQLRLRILSLAALMLLAALGVVACGESDEIVVDLDPTSVAALTSTPIPGATEVISGTPTSAPTLEVSPTTVTDPQPTATLGAGTSTPVPTYGQSDTTSGIEQVAQNQVVVTAANGITATVETEVGVDLPTEYLLGRDYVSYLYQSGMNRNHVMTVTLSSGMSFAADGDYFTVNDSQVGQPGTGDAVIFADNPGTYVFQGYSFGLALGPIMDTNDKAGYVLRDRLYGRPLPMYWFSPEGKVQRVGEPVAAK